MRPSIDQYFMDIARVVATRSTCIRRQIGAVITLDDLVLSTGYNGSCRGQDNCSDGEVCLRDIRKIPSGRELESDHAVHAEQNAILNSPLGLRTLKGLLTIYTTTYPCPICARLIVNAGIRRVVCYAAYSNNDAMELFSKSGVEVCWINHLEV